MYIYNKKKQLICTFLIVTILVLTTGCNQDYTKGTPFDKSEGNNGATTESPDKVSSPETVTEENTSEPSDASSVSDDKAPELSPTANNQEISNNENDSAQESPTESVAPQETTSTATPEIQPETTAPIPTQTIDNQSSDNESKTGLDRDEIWGKTFLIWLPLFPDGSLDKIDYAGTYDYATFQDVSTENAKSYVKMLKESGFTNVNVENYSEGAVSYTATNEKSWEVRLTLTGTTLVIGSGFNDSDTKEEDKSESLFSTTMLQYMPRFEKGTYSSSETRSDASLYASIVYTDVTESDALLYIEQVKDMGYIYVEDEGSLDGILWYIALNDERFECHVEFSGSELKISCGYLEDD